MEEGSKQQLYPDQYSVSAQATPMQPVVQHVQIVPAPAHAPVAPTAAPEVVHHDDKRKDDDSESEDEADQKSPGDIPQKYLNVSACFWKLHECIYMLENVLMSADYI